MTARRARTALAAVVALLCSLFGAIPPAAASWTTGPANTLISPGCTSSSRYADGAIDPGGTVRSFATFVGGSCSGSRIRYGARAGSTTTALTSPYSGVVLAVAADSTATWLLYRASDGTRLGGRTHGGSWKTSKRLSTKRAGSGDLAAVGGRWWAVWSETIGSRASLYDARTIGRNHGRARLTWTTDTDTAPAISLRPAGGAFLAFARRRAANGRREIVYGRWNADKSFATTLLTSNGDNHEPDVLTMSENTVQIAWRHSTRITTALKRSGGLSGAATFSTGKRPRLAASSGHLFVAWTTYGSPTHVRLAERSGNVWVSRDITPGVKASRRAAAVVARSGNARVISTYSSRATLIAQTRPSITSFRGLGTWIDHWDVADFDAAEVTAAVADFKARGVRTLYLQTGRFTHDHDINEAVKIAMWIEAAHARGIRVVGWYLPGYGTHLEKDVRRTLAIASFRTSPATGSQRFDALGIDIERGAQSPTPAIFNADVTTHLRRVRSGVGSAYPISAIVQPPIAMEINRDYDGFPWRSLGAYADVVQPMGYWTFRSSTCDGGNLRHCPYGYSKDNALLARRFTGLPAHEVGGIHSEDPDGPNGPKPPHEVSIDDIRDFVRGTNEAGAIGGSLYDYRTTCKAEGIAGLNESIPSCPGNFWPHLAPLN